MKIYRYKNKTAPCEICGSKMILHNVTGSKKYPMWELVCEKCWYNTSFGIGSDMETQIDCYNRYVNGEL